MNITIVDTLINLVAFERMNDAWLGSLDISIKKIKTAYQFNTNTGLIEKLSRPSQTL